MGASLHVFVVQTLMPPPFLPCASQPLCAGIALKVLLYQQLIMADGQDNSNTKLMTFSGRMAAKLKSRV